MKRKRQEAILRLVRTEQIGTQSDLTTALRASGIPTTQATVSRDIQELGLTRSKVGYRPTLFSDYVVGVQTVQFVTVVRTAPGSANLVAHAIDEKELPGVLGTVAGDDTIIVVHPDSKAGAAFKAFFQGVT